MDSSRLWELWSLHAGDSPASRDEWVALVQRWTEPHRHYHGLEHLLFTLELLQTHGAEPATSLAAWYHDAVYDPRSSTNEIDSAALATESLPRIGLARHAARVSELVLATAGHECPGDDPEATLLLGADLAILGQPPAIYLRYVEGVRREYAHIADDEFRTGRSEILRELLARDRLFVHPAYETLEEPARANLAAELRVYADRP